MMWPAIVARLITSLCTAFSSKFVRSTFLELSRFSTATISSSLRPGRSTGTLNGFIFGVFVIGVIAALASGWFLRVRRYRLARISAVLQIAALVAGWAAAQYPYLIYPDLTLHDAAAPHGVLQFVLWSTPIGMALLLPSLWYLFRVFKGEHLGVREVTRTQ